MEEEKFTLLRRFQYSSEAVIYQGKLESENIEAFLRDNNVVDSNPLYSNAVGGVKLFLRTEDVQKAEEILSDVSLYSVDDYNDLIKCPKCNEEKVEMTTTFRNWKTFFNVIWSGLLALTFEKHHYKCQNCKHEFK